MEKSVGTSELRLLKYVAETGPLSVRAAHDGFGEPLGLVRTTTQQMMERLRKKGLLERFQTDSGLQYRALEESQAITRGAIQNFVNQALGGSITPLVSYLAEQTNLTEAQRQELNELVAQLEDHP